MPTTFFAQIVNNIVTDVRVVTQEYMDENPERYTGLWVETFRDVEGIVYAGVGFAFDGTNFVAPIFDEP